MNILIIEDNKSDIDLLDKYIKDMSQESQTDSATTMKDAIQKVAEKEYDLIFLDLCLPDSEGFDTITELKEAIQHSQWNQDIAVIVLTGTADYEIGKKALSIGIKDFLTKDAINAKTINRSINMSNYKKHLPKKKSKISSWL